MPYLSQKSSNEEIWTKLLELKVLFLIKLPITLVSSILMKILLEVLIIKGEVFKYCHNFYFPTNKYIAHIQILFESIKVLILFQWSFWYTNKGWNNVKQCLVSVFFKNIRKNSSKNIYNSLSHLANFLETPKYKFFMVFASFCIRRDKKWWNKSTMEH